MGKEELSEDQPDWLYEEPSKIERTWWEWPIDPYELLRQKLDIIRKYGCRTSRLRTTFTTSREKFGQFFYEDLIAEQRYEYYEKLEYFVRTYRDGAQPVQHWPIDPYTLYRTFKLDRKKAQMEHAGVPYSGERPGELMTRERLESYFSSLDPWTRESVYCEWETGGYQAFADTVRWCRLHDAFQRERGEANEYYAKKNTEASQ